MKRTLSLWILSTCVLGWAAAQDATTVLVAPSDQIKYPDASQVLNKTDTPTKIVPAPVTPATTPSTPATPVADTTTGAVSPPPATTPVAASSGLPTLKPLLASTPVRAQAPAPVPTPGPVASSDHGWFLKWTLTGDEAGAQGWVKNLSLPASLHPVSSGVWEVWAGPLEPSALKAALKGQAGIATLVRR